MEGVEQAVLPPVALPDLDKCDVSLAQTRLGRRREVLKKGACTVRRGWGWVSGEAVLVGDALRVEGAAGAVVVAVDVCSVDVRGRAVVVGGSGGEEVVVRFGAEKDAWATVLKGIVRGVRWGLGDFDVVMACGKGGGGEVYLVRESGGGVPLAMKVVQKYDAFHSDASLRHALDERLVLELARDCPFVVSLTHAFQTEKALYMCTEFAAGGDLKSALRRRKGGRFSEDEARRIMAQVVLALEHVHSLNVLYRDLKPENVLLTADGDVRLCDFGLSKLLSTGRYGRTKSFCGTTMYMSPEIVTRKSYGIATDLWSLGAMFYRVLVGRAPFEDNYNAVNARNDSPDVYRRIQLDDLYIPATLSRPAREMLEGLMRKNEADRWNLEELKEAEFFSSIDWDDVLQEGVRNAAQPGGVLMGNADIPVDNFDSDRVKGMTLVDEERRSPSSARGLTPRREDASRAKFPKRKPSRLNLAAFMRHRGGLRRKPSATSVIGFSFSHRSDGSLRGTDAFGDSTRTEVFDG